MTKKMKFNIQVCEDCVKQHKLIAQKTYCRETCSICNDWTWSCTVEAIIKEKEK